jgi:hypothetical protein
MISQVWGSVMFPAEVMHLGAMNAGPRGNAVTR